VLKLLLYFALLVIVVFSYNDILLLFYQYNYVNIRATTTHYMHAIKIQESIVLLFFFYFVATSSLFAVR
jgi:hypothetical protein